MFKTSSAAPVLCDILSGENQGTYKLMSGCVISQWRLHQYISLHAAILFLHCATKCHLVTEMACITADKLAL